LFLLPRSPPPEFKMSIHAICKSSTVSLTVCSVPSFFIPNSLFLVCATFSLYSVNIYIYIDHKKFS
jgi:hypothetical protein